MKLTDLVYEFPESLIATEPNRPTRVLWSEANTEPAELSISQLLDKVSPGDIFIINNTEVLKRRIFAKDQTEILFLDLLESKESSNIWSVLFPSKKLSVGAQLQLPNHLLMRLIEKGRPQKVEVSPSITERDFNEIGEMPLPPYIQKSRDLRHNVASDEEWYQTKWAKVAGSMAAPTASLHFTKEDLQKLKDKGVHIVEVTLHVGLGTFLPVVVDNLDEHKMHSEFYNINQQDWDDIKSLKKEGAKVWAMGTTVVRVIESVARTGKLSGHTDILIKPGFEFKITDRLLTNFHQPKSTLLALVAAFAGLEKVKENYKIAIDKKFKLFSYGDLSVWIK